MEEKAPKIGLETSGRMITPIDLIGDTVRVVGGSYDTITLSVLNKFEVEIGRYEIIVNSKGMMVGVPL